LFKQRLAEEQRRLQLRHRVAVHRVQF
jgi:hypothetical protein